MIIPCNNQEKNVADIVNKWLGEDKTVTVFSHTMSCLIVHSVKETKALNKIQTYVEIHLYPTGIVQKLVCRNRFEVNTFEYFKDGILDKEIYHSIINGNHMAGRLSDGLYTRVFFNKKPAPNNSFSEEYRDPRTGLLHNLNGPAYSHYYKGVMETEYHIQGKLIARNLGITGPEVEEILKNYVILE